jgi:CelD/BcsL family acetyltransferase involved in cellulose biosynthesis
MSAMIAQRLGLLGTRMDPMNAWRTGSIFARARGVTANIVRAVPASEHEWQRFWEDCSTATYFHSPEWARIWAEYGRGRIRPAAKLVQFSDGAEALVPWCFEVKAHGLLSRYVGSIHGTYGGWLSREPLHVTQAVRLVQWLTREQGRSVVWRMNPYDDGAFRAGVLAGLRCRSDVTHAIRLPRTGEQLLKGFKASYRSQIRKALSGGEFTLSVATTIDEWREYFGVYQDSLARWGDAPETGYGWRLFELWARLRSPNAKLWIARHQGRIVSGDLCLYANRHVAYWHGATLRSHLKSSVAKLLKFEVMQDAIRRGLDWYDFNPSAGLSGVKFFKEGFNASTLPAPIVYADSPLKQLVRGVAASLELRHAQLSLQPLQELLECYNCASPVAIWGRREGSTGDSGAARNDDGDADVGLAPAN